MKHYSYTFYRDPHHAHQYEGDRFGGPVGLWLLDMEVRTFIELAKPAAGEWILDVGTGAGKLIPPMTEAGATVVATDASAAMLQHAIAKKPHAWAVVDGHQLAFADHRFDTVLSSRVLMHVVKPENFIGELCRVSRHRVVIDFPPKTSSNLLLPLFLPIKRRIDPNTHAYRVFGVREVQQMFEKHGFSVVAQHRQLFLPHFVHRKLGRPALSQKLESFFQKIGLTSVLGAPVTLVAERRA